MDGDDAAGAASFLGAWILAREGRLTQLDLSLPLATLAYPPSRTRTYERETDPESGDDDTTTAQRLPEKGEKESGRPGVSRKGG